MTSETSAALSGDREIVVTRVIDAPPELVFRAFTDPERIIEWWGPTGFRTTTTRMDVRPGGIWSFVMHGPDGHDYANRITYLEVDAPHLLAYQHGGGDELEHVNFSVTVSFEDADGSGARTRVTMRSLFASAAVRDFVVADYGALEGGRQNLERLADHLRKSPEDLPGATRPFVISRVYRAPRELLWRLWTESEHMQRWFGPKGVTIVSARLDLRPGGVYHFGMQSPGGPVMWGKWVFREIVPHERLVFVSSFSDAEGALARHPMSATWPLETLATIRFAEHAGKGGGTTLVIEWLPINADAAERRTFDAGHDSMQQGWTGTLDQLEGYLSREAAST
jgi:uncharacterized protein YndB with AHSA1/START domain